MAQMNVKGNSNKLAFGPTVLMKIVTGTLSTNVFLLTIIVNFAVNEICLKIHHYLLSFMAAIHHFDLK